MFILLFLAQTSCYYSSASCLVQYILVEMCLKCVWSSASISWSALFISLTFSLFHTFSLSLMTLSFWNMMKLAHPFTRASSHACFFRNPHAYGIRKPNIHKPKRPSPPVLPRGKLIAYFNKMGGNQDPLATTLSFW